MASKEKKKYSQQYDQYMGQSQGYQNTLMDRGGAADTASTHALTAGLDPTAVSRMRGVQEQGIGDYGSMVSGLYAHPGYSDVEQRGMRLGITAPTSAAFNTGRADLARQGAASGNMGGAMAGSAELAREKARVLAPQLSGLQGKFGDARRADVGTAIGAQAQIPGMASQQIGQEQQQAGLLQNSANMNMQGATALSGQRVGMMDQLNQQAQKPGFWSQLAMAGMSTAGAALGTAAGKKLG